MVSTPIVLEVLRKAIVGYSIDEIMEAFKSKNSSQYKTTLKDNMNTKDIIITACFTGDGASKKIAHIIQSKIANQDIDIFTINIVDEKKLESRLEKLREKYNILVIISTVPLDIEWVPVLSAINIFTGKEMEKLDHILGENRIYTKISESLTEHLSNVNGNEIVMETRYIIYEIENKLNLTVSSDVKMGIMLHICFLVDNLIDGIAPRRFDNLDSYKKTYKKDMEIIKEILQSIELKYNVFLREDEIAYILNLFLANKTSV